MSEISASGQKTAWPHWSRTDTQHYRRSHSLALQPKRPSPHCASRANGPMVIPGVNHRHLQVGFPEPEDRSPATHFLPQQQALVSEAGQQLPPRSRSFRSAAQHSQGEAMQNTKLLAGKENPAWTTPGEHSLTRPGGRRRGWGKTENSGFVLLPPSSATPSKSSDNITGSPTDPIPPQVHSGSIFTLRTFLRVLRQPPTTP